jgi:tRNA (guanine37-N1)-methyltransferase
MQFDIITIFPKILDSYFKESIIKRAIQDNKITIKTHNLRDWSSDKHKTVDDTPYGGGAGMIMKVEPIYKAVKEIKSKNKKIKSRVILLSAKGEIFNQNKAKDYSKYDQLILICGRYEGVDQRVVDLLVDEEVSIGKFVLTGGELGAAMIVDTVSRLQKGVLGNEESLEEESYSDKKLKMLEYSQYTKPETFKGLKVPQVLLSGNHAKIKNWRDKNKVTI